RRHALCIGHASQDSERSGREVAQRPVAPRSCQTTRWSTMNLQPGARARVGRAGAARSGRHDEGERTKRLLALGLSHVHDREQASHQTQQNQPPQTVQVACTPGLLWAERAYHLYDGPDRASAAIVSPPSGAFCSSRTPREKAAMGTTTDAPSVVVAGTVGGAGSAEARPRPVRRWAHSRSPVVAVSSRSVTPPRTFSAARSM